MARVATTTHAMFKSKQERGALQVPELAKLAANPSAASMWTDVAGQLADDTATQLGHATPRQIETTKKADDAAKFMLWASSKDY